MTPLQKAVQELMDAMVQTDFTCRLGNQLDALEKALEAEQAQGVEPFEIEFPDYHGQAMRYGLEDRNITDRYEAMRYGWDQALERVEDCLPEKLYTHPAPPPAMGERAVEPESQWPTKAAIDALKRFEETCSDGEGYDVPKDAMRALQAVGLVYRTRGNVYATTDFGNRVLAGRFFNQPAPPVEQAQAVEPVATVQCINGVTIGYLDAMQPVGTKLYTHPAPPPATSERAELISRLLDIFKHDWGNPVLREAADMLEADAQDAFTVGLACQPKPQSLSLDLLDRLSKTLTRLGYSTPEGGMEHFGSQIESQLYNLCRGVDSILAQQVAAPMTEAQIFECDPVPHVMFDQQRIDFARAIEAHHGIGAKP